jgi:hypothetical protein
VLDNGNGFREGYGSAPSEERNLISSGEIYNDLEHERDYTTGPIELTTEQYNAVVDFIGDSIANSPDYNFPGSILFPNTIQQCAPWVMDLSYIGSDST